MIKVLQIMDGESYSGICKLFTEIEKNISKDPKIKAMVEDIIKNIRDR